MQIDVCMELGAYKIVQYMCYTYMCLYTYVYTCMRSRYMYVYRYVYPLTEEIRLDIFRSPDSAVYIYIYI